MLPEPVEKKAQRADYDHPELEAGHEITKTTPLRSRLGNLT
jgi:hypothetical protein